MLWNVFLLALLLTFSYFVPGWLGRVFKKWEPEEDFFGRCLWATRTTFFFFATLVGVGFSNLPQATLLGLRPFQLTGLIVGVVLLLIRLVSLPRILFLKKMDIKAKDNLKARTWVTQFIVIERVLVVAILLISFCLVMISFEPLRRMGMSLLASAGLVGVVVGFAAQKSIANILAGIQIAITQPIRIDDVVIMENEWGWIEEINLTYVVVRIWDQRRLIVPISQCIEKPFQNWTRTESSILGSVFLHVDYAFPVDVIRAETTRLLQERSEWDGRCNVVHVTHIGEKCKEVRVLVSSSSSPEAWELRCFLREKLIDFCCREYPQYLSHLRLGGELAPLKAEPRA